MKFLCKVAGHTVPKSGNGPTYMTVKRQGIDNLGTEHAAIETTCPRCGVGWTVGLLHLPRRHKEDRMLTAIGKAQAVLDAAHDEADAILKEACR